MNTTFFTTLSTQEFQELIESSVRNAVHLKPIRPDDEDDTLLDTKEAAELIKYEVTSVYGLVKRKKIPFCKVEGKLLFSRKKLLAWIGSGQQAVAK
ncbi:helix-turn-helix domain-containing protein [Mucilaginibacter endophyticus]|uniref:helix-turn-helix domain-containing protein n=1 Tax=Mucilaginibacter endophyticus TaxID=2675003 RepID=UPI000E0DE9BA|nr:helix-turn-helix domain-containing protein [Mucilaginibacter endophyticus]